MTNYRSDLETAQTYLQAGLRDRARELLQTALQLIPDKDKTQENYVYYRILATLAQIKLEDRELKSALSLINEGLQIFPLHIDLLFLKCLYEWEMRQYDQMFISLVCYINCLDEEQSRKQQSVYVSKEVIHQVFATLLPVAYKYCSSRNEMRTVVKKIEMKSNHPIIRVLNHTMEKIDAAIG